MRQFLLDTLKTFLDPEFGPDQAVKLLGDSIAKTKDRWIIKPKEEVFSKIILSLEDLPAGDGLMTTMIFEFQKPWNPVIEKLEEDWGPIDRWLPATGKGRPKTLQFYKENKPLNGMIMLKVAEKKEIDYQEHISVPSVSLRRIFGKFRFK